jgi:sugar phosphate isomerase/epimerase
MRLSLVTDSLGFLPFEAMLDRAAALGFEALELCCGGWSAAPHLDLDGLLSSASRRRAFLDVLAARGLSIEALNCSGNQLAPNAEGEAHRVLVEKTFALASLLGVGKIVMMSGLPGGGRGESLPNWITTSWPPRNAQILAWQWEEVALPYWRRTVEAAKAAGIKRLALENHGCQLVYNPSTLLRLRAAVGETVGMNLDPSHLFWMGGDPIAAARFLGKAIHHVHAKDARLERGPFAVDGALDTRPIADYAERTWNYVALGLGHEASWWKDFVAALGMAGYDGGVSLEMEDLSLDAVTGIERSLAVLREALPARKDLSPRGGKGGGG